MQLRLILVAPIAIVAACRIERKPDATSDTTNAPPPAKGVDTPTPTAPAPSTNWTVTPAGIGAIRVGMTADELRGVAGAFDLPKPAAECSYVRPTAVPPGVLVMVAKGMVARIDVDSAGVRSDAGVSVGDSASRVNSAYAGRVTATPHKYVPGGQYLTVRAASPSDSALRIVFETDSGRVTRFRSGRVPEVGWVERCG